MRPYGQKRVTGRGLTLTARRLPGVKTGHSSFLDDDGYDGLTSSRFVP